MTYTVAPTTAGVRFAAAPEVAALAAAGTLGTRSQIEGELDGIMVYVRDFWTMEPDQVMAHCASFSARLTELEVLLHRVEARNREYKQIRTLQVQKLIEELERQFKIASRLVEVRRQDIETAKGF